MENRQKPPEWAVRTNADREALEAECWWDAEAADRIIRFAQTYVRPKFSRGEFRLLPWQSRFLQSLYGWKKADGNRRFRRAVLFTSKKSGKGLLCGILALAEMFLSDEPSPLVVSCSTSRDNASQIYKEVAASLKANPTLAKLAKFTDHTKRIRIPSKGSEYFAASSDSTTGHGFNCSLVIVDEAAWHRSRDLFDAFQFGQSGRSNGLCVVITTAGEMDGWFYGEYSRAKRILNGEDGDQSTYAEVYEADPDGPDGYLEDPKQWAKASPSLDQYPGYTSDNFRADLYSAKGDAASWLNFRRMRLNLWLKASAENWIDPNRWMSGKCPEPENLPALPCWVALDLSQRVDPSSVGCCWQLPDNRFYFKSWAWVARKGVQLREKQNLRRYDEFPDVVITDGDMIDQSKIKQHVLWLCSAYNVQEITADAYNAITMMEELGRETGRAVSKFPQNFKSYTDVCKQWERAINEGRAKHDGGQYLVWNVGNLRLAQDKWGNVMPDRGRSVDKIDGAITCLMSYGLANRATVAVQPSVYNSRPLSFLSDYD